MTEFTEFVRIFGFPSAIIVIIALALWRGSRWFAEYVAKPIIEAHTKFIDSLKNTTEKQADAAHIASLAADKSAEAALRQASTIDKINETLTELKDQSVCRYKTQSGA